MRRQRCADAVTNDTTATTMRGRPKNTRPVWCSMVHCGASAWTCVRHGHHPSGHQASDRLVAPPSGNRRVERRHGSGDVHDRNLRRMPVNVSKRSRPWSRDRGRWRLTTRRSASVDSRAAFFLATHQCGRDRFGADDFCDRMRRMFAATCAESRLFIPTQSLVIQALRHEEAADRRVPPDSHPPPTPQSYCSRRRRSRSPSGGETHHRHPPPLAQAPVERAVSSRPQRAEPNSPAPRSELVESACECFGRTGGVNLLSAFLRRGPRRGLFSRLGGPGSAPATGFHRLAGK